MIIAAFFIFIFLHISMVSATFCVLSLHLGYAGKVICADNESSLGAKQFGAAGPKQAFEYGIVYIERIYHAGLYVCMYVCIHLKDLAVIYRGGVFIHMKLRNIS